MPQEHSFLGTSIKLALGKHHVPTEGTTLYMAPCHPKAHPTQSESTS